MFNRKTSAPFSISRCRVSVFSVAGPSVQMILVFRTGGEIEDDVDLTVRGSGQKISGNGYFITQRTRFIEKKIRFPSA
jgi:hypothetical protein